MRATSLLLLLAACDGSGGGGMTADAAHRWTWTFVDPLTSETVGCPPNVESIEISAWDHPSSQGESCTNDRGWVRQDVQTFPCGDGHADYSPPGVPRIDVLMSDGRIYARLEGAITEPVVIPTRRGFVNLNWSLVARGTTTPRPCFSGDVIDTPWLGPRDAIVCAGSAMGARLLPGMPASSYSLEVVLRFAVEACRIIDDTKTVSDVVVSEDTVTEAMVVLEH